MNDVLALSLADVALTPSAGPGPAGTAVFRGLVELAQRALERLRSARRGSVAVVSRLRGTGRGVSASALLDTLERDHPLQLVAPFEGSPHVSGAVWRGDRIVGPESKAAVAWLRWAPGATDLPMHVHDHSDRFIVVRKGRGYFHVSRETPEAFTGSAVRSIPAREHDVFLFTRGVVHTFSTDREAMDLFSCQLPFLPFDDPEQYRLPALRWTASEHPRDCSASVAPDPAWTVLAQQASGGFLGAGSHLCGS